MKRTLSLVIILTLIISMLTSCSMLDIVFGVLDAEDVISDNIIEIVTGNKKIYNEFTPSEQALIKDYFGTLIPFAPNNEYYIEEYEFEDDGVIEVGLHYYTFGNTWQEFESYKSLFSSYVFEGTSKDEYGDTWYSYYASEEDFYIDLSYYTEDGERIIDLYAYYYIENEGNGGSGNEGGGNEGGGGNGTGNITEDGVITNEGAGLPKGSNGIHRVDFTKADKVKDVTDQGYYLDGCPTVGKVPVLVIPVEFSNSTAKSKGYTIENIKRAFTGNDTDYYSVEEYYYISSYGMLDLEFTVVDSWFRPDYSSTYYETLTQRYNGEEYFIGDQVIMDEALEYLSKSMDLSKFDSDNNGIIDAVIMINTLTIDDQSDFHWAYRYWNDYTDKYGYFYEYDGVSANDYIWASYQFMHESYDERYGYSYDDTGVMNTYTYIHEFGHILGVDDYYDTSYRTDTTPLDGCDIMDGMTGDHNPYTKFNLGWLTTSKLITTSTSITLTLDSFTETGDTIIIANNWVDSLGAYQEYYIVVYYTMTGLNGGEYGYFSREGIIVYHVNASLYCEEFDDEMYYDVYNNNTSYTGTNGYGTKDNLIEFVKSVGGNFTYVEGDSLPALTDDCGNRLGYSFRVDSIENGKATLTFNKK